MTARTALTVKKPATTIMITATARLDLITLMDRIHPLSGRKIGIQGHCTHRNSNNYYPALGMLKSGDIVAGWSPKSKIPNGLEKKPKEESSELTKAATEIN